jgi:hypothetical protein
MAALSAANTVFVLEARIDESSSLTEGISFGSGGLSWRAPGTVEQRLGDDSPRFSRRPRGGAVAGACERPTDSD